MNALLYTAPEWVGDVADLIERRYGVYSTTNFEQLLVMVKEGSINKVCILMGGCTIAGDEAAEKLHEVNPDMPIIVWDSCGSTRIASNELYLNARDFKTEDFFTKISKFYSDRPL